MTGAFFIAMTVVFTVAGQIMVKRGVLTLAGDAGLLRAATQPWIVAGLLCAVFAAVAWIKALTYFPLSVAYPFMSLSFVLVALLSTWVLGEHVKGTQWAGLAIVLLGLYIGSR